MYYKGRFLCTPRTVPIYHPGTVPRGSLLRWGDCWVDLGRDMDETVRERVRNTGDGHAM